ncbi:MAG: peptide deformylase [Clostridia bacterium]|nr:peptide deformylase [Clostridia bacterium]
MILRNIRRYPNDGVLRKRSRKIRRISDKTSILLEEMAGTMYAEKGSGLSAVQVGILRRAVVIDCGSGLVKLLNPVVVKARGEQREIEGCLSIPGIFGRVKRPERVVVRALDEKGRKVELEATGFSARILCHEIDHLDGILFIDKVIPGSIFRRKPEKRSRDHKGGIRNGCRVYHGR